MIVADTDVLIDGDAEDRDGMLKAGMETGLNESCAALDEVLAGEAAGQKGWPRRPVGRSARSQRLSSKPPKPQRHLSS